MVIQASLLLGKFLEMKDLHFDRHPTNPNILNLLHKKRHTYGYMRVGSTTYRIF